MNKPWNLNWHNSRIKYHVFKKFRNIKNSWILNRAKSLKIKKGRFIIWKINWGKGKNSKSSKQIMRKWRRKWKYMKRWYRRTGTHQKIQNYLLLLNRKVLKLMTLVNNQKVYKTIVIENQISKTTMFSSSNWNSLQRRLSLSIGLFPMSLNGARSWTGCPPIRARPVDSNRCSRKFLRRTIVISCSHKRWIQY